MSTPRVSTVAAEELDVLSAHEAWRLRQQVFVVEQECAYADLDGRDLAAGTHHVLLHDDGRLIGTGRVLDEGECWRVGRLALARTARGRGLGDLLVRTALEVCGDGRAVVLDAQSPLAGWYAGFGFEVAGPEFLDDGIPHLPMRRPGRPPLVEQGS